MKSIRQIMRQPVRTLAGVLLVALAVAVMCVSVSQTLAAANTAGELSRTFMTVALPTADIGSDGGEIIDDLAAENPDIFKADVYNGLASAYIQGLQPDNYTQHLYQTDGSTANSALEPASENYSNAMFEVVIMGKTSPAEVVEYYGPTFVPYNTGYAEMTIFAEIVGTIGLEQGFNDPMDRESAMGRELDITVRMASLEELEAFEESLDLNAEDHYLVYGSDFTDLDWELRCHMASIMVWREEPQLLDWELDSIEGFADFNAQMREESAARAEGREPDPKAYTRLKVKIGDLYHGLTWEEMDMFLQSSLTLANKAALPRPVKQNVWQDEDGTVFVQMEFDESETVSYVDAQGRTVTLSMEEYAQRYETPMIAKLEGSVEDFLAENPQWQEMLDNININSASFPIVGVEGLEYVGQFATGKAEIVEGRGFSEEEIAAGARVCVMAKSLAEANGLGVGDTIDPRFYQYDPIYPGQSKLEKGSGVVNHTAHFYCSDTTPFAGQAEEYTIIGLYEQDSPWGKVDDDYYAFTPNTIFVPKASVPVSMEYSSHGMFRTLVVESDKLLELQLLIVEEDLDGIFYFYDNGYSKVADQLDAFRDAAERFLPVGLVMYGILILLFIFLFPGRQGRELAMMDSMGCELGGRVRHVLAGCLGIVIPGTAVGTVLGLLLWERLALFLAQWVEVQVSVELDAVSLWVAAGVQVLAVALMTLLAAVPMAKRASLMRRK